MNRLEVKSMGNGNININLSKIFVALIIFAITGWVGWITLSTITHSNRLSSVESGMSYIQKDISQMMDLVKEIRHDQQRREARDKK